MELSTSFSHGYGGIDSLPDSSFTLTVFVARFADSCRAWCCAIRPFEGDLAAKDGTISANIRQQDDKEAQEGPNGWVTAIKEWVDERKLCLAATFPCLYRSRARVHVERLLETTHDSKSSLAVISPQTTSVATRTTKVMQKLRLTRRDAGHRYREQQLSIVELCSKYDPENSGRICSHQVRALMEELNFPHPVSEFAVKFVIQTTQANPHCSTEAIPRAELQLVIPLYLALQHEQQYVESQIDKFHHGNPDQVPVATVTALLSTINDGVPPTDQEMDHILRQVYSGDGLPTQPSVLSRDDVWRAVAIFYPKVHRRHMVAAPAKTEGAVGGRRQRVRQQAEMHATDLERSLPHGSPIMTQTELRSLMATLNDMKPVDDEDVEFVLRCANICTPLCIHPAEVSRADVCLRCIQLTGAHCMLVQVRPALALFMALREEQEHIDAKFEEYDRDKTGDLSFDQLSALLRDLDDGQ